MKKHIILLSALLLTGTVKAQSPLPGKTEILEAIVWGTERNVY